MSYENIEAMADEKSTVLRLIGMAPYWESLKTHDGSILWGSTLWLFPGEWYTLIPEGYKLTDIRGREVTFIKGKTSSDVRRGYLAFGIMVAPDS